MSFLKKYHNILHYNARLKRNFHIFIAHFVFDAKFFHFSFKNPQWFQNLIKKSENLMTSRRHVISSLNFFTQNRTSFTMSGKVKHTK